VAGAASPGRARPAAPSGATYPGNARAEPLDRSRDSTAGSGADLADPPAELALAERLPGEPGRSRQVRHHRLAFGRVGILQDHAEKEKDLAPGDFFGKPLAQTCPFRGGEMLGDERQDVLLLVVKVIEQRGAVLGERADQRRRGGRRGRGPPSAATVGQEADVELLVDAADTDEDGVITGFEAGVIAGLLTEPGPGRVRFVHALVRDTVYADLTKLRLTRMHARVGAAIRRLRPGDVSALAHHYLRAASADSAEAAVGYAIKAAERADRRYSYDAAVSLLEQALEAFARTPGALVTDWDSPH